MIEATIQQTEDSVTSEFSEPLEEIALESEEAASAYLPSLSPHASSKKAGLEVSYSDFLSAFQGQTNSTRRSLSSEALDAPSLLALSLREGKPLSQSLLTGLTTSSKSLPIYGLTPCTAYCSSCRREVHTQVEPKSKLPKLFQLLSRATCYCAWFLQGQTHRCPHCASVLAATVSKNPA